jgi:hypothetical protein
VIPACGTPIEKRRVHPDALLDMRLPRHARKVLALLMRRPRNEARTAECIHAMYADDPSGGPECADKVFDKVKRQLKRALEPRGFTVRGCAHHRRPGMTRIEAIA